MPLTNEWAGDWDEIGTDHVFPDFRAMFVELYYGQRNTLTDILAIIHFTHPQPTLKELRAQLKKMDLPLRESDKESITAKGGTAMSP